jgi:5-methylcytosine-specific restriction endonuclease McrA
MSRAWDGGSTRAWRRIRARILARDNYTCRLHLPGTWTVRDSRGRPVLRRCLIAADCVHHVQGRAVTGDDPRYMIAACTPCNLKVGAPDGDPPNRPVTRW